MVKGVFTQLPWGNLTELNKAGKEFALPSMINGEPGGIPTKDFSSLISGPLDKVSDQIKDSEQKVESFLIDPDSVDPHDVTLALAKANMSVSMTKQVVNTALKAYREITSLR